MDKIFTELSKLDSQSSSEIAGKHPKKNRYSDVKPYDFNLVPIPSYINASFLRSSRSSINFIATQGPIPDTYSDFWIMAHIHNVQAITMLVDAASSQPNATKRGNCHAYWPDKNSDFVSGPLCVKLRSETRAEDYLAIPNNCTNVVLRVFDITYNGITKSTTHFHFLGWEDRQVANEIDLINFLTFFNDFIKQFKIFSNICVHCSAGCGRTGVFITLLAAMYTTSNGQSSFDLINNLVFEFRSQRIYFVQTLVIQLSFSSSWNFVIKFILWCTRPKMPEKKSKISKKSQKTIDDFNVYAIQDKEAQQNILTSSSKREKLLLELQTKKSDFVMNYLRLVNKQKSESKNANYCSLKKRYGDQLFEGINIVDVSKEQQIRTFIAKSGTIEEFETIFNDYLAIHNSTMPAYIIACIKAYFFRIADNEFGDATFLEGNVEFCQIKSTALLSLCKIAFLPFSELYVTRIKPKLQHSLAITSTSANLLIFNKQQMELDKIFPEKTIYCSLLGECALIPISKGFETSENLLLVVQEKYPVLSHLEMSHNIEKSAILFNLLGTTVLFSQGSDGYRSDNCVVNVQSTSDNMDLAVGLAILSKLSIYYTLSRTEDKISVILSIKNGETVAKDLGFSESKEDGLFYVQINPRYEILSNQLSLYCVAFGKSIEESTMDSVSFYSCFLEFAGLVSQAMGITEENSLKDCIGIVGFLQNIL